MTTNNNKMNRYQQELNNNIIPKQKLDNLIKKHHKISIETDAAQLLQKYSEIFLTDILNKTSEIISYKNSNTINVEDIDFILKKDYDIVLTDNCYEEEDGVPTDCYMGKIADISKHNI